MASKPRMVVCAAIRNSDGGIITGPRHYDMFMSKQLSRNFIGDEFLKWFNDENQQGFIDQFGVFMTREEAYEVATEAGQIKYRCGGDDGVLYSENLY